MGRRKSEFGDDAPPKSKKPKREPVKFDSESDEAEGSDPEAATETMVNGHNVKTYPLPDVLSEQTKQALEKMGIPSLFDVQHRSLDLCMNGDDMILQARTGSGKTLAFALPTVERLIQSNLKLRPNQPRVLVMAPTRELAAQICKVFNQLCEFVDFNAVSVYGGASYDQQRRELGTGKAGIVVGTPGRLKDLCDGGSIDLSKAKVCILDEVDRMLDMGFAEIVEELLQRCPYMKKGKLSSKKPQTLFFSATCPEWVEQHANTYMTEDRQHIKLVDDSNIGGTSKTVEHLYVQIDKYDAIATCVRDLVRLYSAGKQNGRAIVFTQTKREANDLALGDIAIGDAQVMHGDIEQKQREVTLKGFREGKFRCLVATDVAARGLDIPEIDLVCCTSPPTGNDLESYVHRSGRTGRAGKKGVSVCIVSFKNKWAIKQIEQETGIEFREIPIPQPIDVARSVMKEKLADDIALTISDERATFENFEDIAQDVIKMCAVAEEDDASDSGNEDSASNAERNRLKAAEKAVACLITYIAQGGEDLKSRSLISGKEGWQTWLIEADGANGHPMGLVRSALGRQHVPYEAIQKVTDWRELAEPSSLGGYGVVFDLPGPFTKELLALWPEDTKRRCGREQCKISRVETELPELKGFRGQGGGRGRGRGGGGRGGGGFRGNSGRSSFGGRSDSRGGRGGGGSSGVHTF